MQTPDEYLAYIKSLLISAPNIANFSIIREETQGSIGLYRYKVAFDDGNLLEMFERFEVRSDGKIHVTKYSFHWQNAKGILRKRWDNAAHHPEVSTYPHHVHDGSEENVLPHKPIMAADCLNIISEEHLKNL